MSSLKPNSGAPPKLEKPKGAQFKSKVWEHFGFPIITEEDGSTQVDRNTTVCRGCATPIKYTGSTTNMATHIRRHHPNYELSRTSKENTLASSSSTTSPGQLRILESFNSKLAPTSQRAQSITRSIGKFIALDMRPYSVVENKGFKDLLHVLEPKYTIPSRPHITDTVIPALYNETREMVKNDISNAESISITTDGWTSRAT